MNELLPSGLAFLRAVDSFTEGVKDPARALADELGLLTTTAGSLIAAAKNWRKIDAELERHVDKLSIQKLQIISQAMNKTTDPEGVREALVAYATRPTDARREPTADELKRYAQTVVAGNKPKKPRCSLLFSRHEDATGTRYAQLALPSAHMDRFEALVRKWWPGDKEKEKSPALKNAIGLQRLLNATSGTDGDGRWDLSIVPAFIVSAPGTTYVGDGKFVTTDGDVLSGDDISDYHLRDFGYVTIYDGHGNIGCHYLLENERLASKEIRSALVMDQIFCAADGCHELALYSQAHHSIAFKDGGKTDAQNILLACKPHNIYNDDDRYTTGKQENGWLGRDEHGRAGRKPPHDEHIRPNVNYGVQYSGRSIALKQLGLE
ncbi:HNH endonuclease signature motif containing protein [uncultured Corynebacterium sp.]|uniref:HNH endonuclease signature motif containing protein n=1 Tax=uncultured Corynebacterium sp. TaxID=159447 RepID=UPI002624C3EA|nr:HNH endonuclease signature motif containing protein [uncultured Corynebacterium sp.]